MVAETKPASRVICQTRPYNDGYAGLIALPGLYPDFVRRGEEVVVLKTAGAARNEALEALFRLYDSRTRDTRTAGGYKRLTGAEFAALLAKINVTPTFFAEISGFPQARIMKWIDGEQDIPHSVHVLVILMADSKRNIDLAEEITEKCKSDASEPTSQTSRSG